MIHYKHIIFMKKFEITFSNKKSKTVLKTVIVENHSDLGILMRGKIKASEEGFVFDAKKHSASFQEISLKYSKGNWSIDGTHIVSFDGVNGSFNETICDINPETEYPTVHERSEQESLKNAELICKAPKMYEAIQEILSIYDDGSPNFGFVKSKLLDAIS